MWQHSQQLWCALHIAVVRSADVSVLLGVYYGSLQQRLCCRISFSSRGGPSLSSLLLQQLELVS